MKTTILAGLLMAFLYVWVGLSTAYAAHPDSAQGQIISGVLQKTYIEVLRDSAPKERFVDKLRFGGNFGVQFGNATVVNFSPALGFQLTEKFLAGIGLTYQYVNWKGFFGESHMFGARVFAQYDIWGGILAHAEYEWLNYNYQGDNARLNSHALFLGGGYQYRITDRFVTQVVFLYNVLNKSGNSPYINPFVIRAGVLF